MGKKKVLGLTSLSHFLNDGNLVVLPVVYSYVIDSLGVPNYLVGIFGAIFFAVSAIASPFIGRIADRRNNGGHLIGFGIITWGISLILLGFAVDMVNIPFMFVAVFISGFSSAFYHPLSGAVLSGAYGKNAGSVMGINGAFGSIGRAVYPTITLAIFDFLSKQKVDMLYSLTVIGIISIVASFFVMTLKSESKSDENKKKINDNPTITDNNFNKATIYDTTNNTMSNNTTSNNATSNNATSNNTTSNNSTSYNNTPMKISMILLLLTFVSFFNGIFAQGVLQFLPTLLVQDYNITYGIQLGILMTSILLIAVVGQPLLGRMSDKWGRKYTLFVAFGASLLVYTLFLLLHSIYWLFLFGVFAFNNFALVLTLVSDVMPKSRGFGNSVVWGLGTSSGGALGPLIVGFTSGPLGLINSMLIVTAIGTIALILILFIPKPETKKE